MAPRDFKPIARQLEGIEKKKEKNTNRLFKTHVPGRWGEDESLTDFLLGVLEDVSGGGGSGAQDCSEVAERGQLLWHHPAALLGAQIPSSQGEDEEEEEEEEEEETE